MVTLHTKYELIEFIHLNLHKNVSINCDFVFGDITFIKNKLW